MTKESVKKKIDGEARAEAQQAPQAPSLDLQDLALALNVMNTAIKRGTFEPKELRGVLDVYEKIEAFLQFQAQLQAEAAKANADTAKERGEG